MDVALLSIRCFQLVESVRHRKVNGDLKSARRNTLAHKNQGKSSSRVNGQEAATDIQLEMNSRVGRIAKDK